MNEGNRKGIAGQARNDGVVYHNDSLENCNDGVVICNGFGINR